MTILAGSEGREGEGGGWVRIGELSWAYSYGWLLNALLTPVPQSESQLAPGAGYMRMIAKLTHHFDAPKTG